MKVRANWLGFVAGLFVLPSLAGGDWGIRKIAREVGVGVGTVQRVKAAMAA
jgi:hypothetical protein